MSTSSSEAVDRFLWISASSDSEDYEMTMSDVKVNGHAKTKKRIKADLDVSPEVNSNAVRRSKKRKLSISSDVELENKVKAELASDTESARRKRKKDKHIKGEYEASDTAANSRELADNDSYLELRIKEESFMQSPHKDKKRKKSITDDQSYNDQSFFSSTQIEVKQERDKMFNERENIDGTSTKKKKKKHKKGEKKEFEFNADETVEQSPVHNGIETQKKHTSFKSRRSSQQTSIHEGISVSPSPEVNNTNSGDKCISDNKVSKSKSMIEISVPECPSRKLKISERITFEEDLDYSLQSESHKKTEKDVQSIKHGLVNKYIRDGNLQNTQTIIPRSILTEDDDVWMIKCPREITSSALGAIELSVEGKGKIKIDGATYDSSVEPDMGHLNVQLCPEGKYIIKSVPVKGVLHLRRRIPKPHSVLVNSMVNKHQFIPLPETKLRHPLFGADYRAAVKVPSRAARRLRGHAGRDAHVEAADAADATLPNSTGKKKKRKRKRSAETDEGALESEERGGAEREADAPPPKRKRPKRDLDGGTWDSAQAIEDNLFNF